MCPGCSFFFISLVFLRKNTRVSTLDACVMWPLTVCHVIISIQFLFLATSCHFQIAWNCSKFPYLHHFTQVEGNLLLWHHPHDPSPTPLWIPLTLWLLFYGEWKLLTACNSRERRQRRQQPPSRKCPGFWPISSSFQQSGTHARPQRPSLLLPQPGESLASLASSRRVPCSESLELFCTVSLVLFLTKNSKELLKKNDLFKSPIGSRLHVFSVRAL